MLEKCGERYMNKIQPYSYSEGTYHKNKSNCLPKNRVPHQHFYRLSNKQNPQKHTIIYADFDYTKKKSSEQKLRELLSKNDNTLDLLIKAYFLAAPSDRPIQCKFIAKYLNSVEGILLVLEWSRKKMVKESYDSAVGLLSECGKILFKVIDNEAITSLFTKDVIAYEEKLEVLIKGIAFAHNIPPQERLKAITNSIPRSRRLIKTMIIDALLILDDEINIDILKNHLASFLSNDELDEYVRQYAKDALESF
jgi:hypothetical protein